MISRILTILLPLALLTGCAGPKIYGASPEITLLQSDTLPVPSGAADASGGYDARISRYDTIIIDVLGFDELKERRFVVDGSGDITLPIAGNVRVAGTTTSEAAAVITRQMQAGHVRQPQVGVNFYEIASNYVTVQGSVTQPGNYPALDGMTLTRAIAAAKGFTDVSQLRDVVVLRTVDGRQYAALYDMNAIQQANYPDPAVFAHDTIIVGESAQRRLLQRLIAGAPLLVTPIVAAFQTF